MKKITLLSIAFLMITSLSWAQTENCKILKQGQSSPEAKIDQLSWLVGHWKGEALGGVTEEIWSPAMEGAMMGSFRLVSKGVIKFYELMTITEEDNSLILRIKHFDSQLKGWEEKDESEEFKLVEAQANKLYFNGLTFEKVNADEINIYVIFDNKEGQEEMKFNYKKHP